MAKPKIVKPRFIVRNGKQKAVRVLGEATIGPNVTADLFNIINQLSESTVIDALREPDGNLYKEIYQLKNLELIDCELITLSASSIVGAGAQEGKILSLGKNGLEWIELPKVSGNAEVSVDAPLAIDSGKLYLAKADAQNSGYLSKEDWLKFSQINNRVRIWQYQTFEGHVPAMLKLSKFENGAMPFDASWIVDNSAVVAKKDGQNAFGASLFGKMFGKGKPNVVQHSSDAVVLDGDIESAGCTIWFLISVPADTKVDDYISAPKWVRDSRAELLSQSDIDTSGGKNIWGNRVFVQDVMVDGKLGINTRTPTAHLDVAGTIKTSDLVLQNDANYNYSLVSDSIGRAQWKPVPFVGDKKPSNPYDGQIWVKMPEYESFVFDERNNIWIGTSCVQVIGARQSTSVSNSYLNGADRLPLQNAPLVLPFDCILSSCSATHSGDVAWTLEVHADSSPIKNASMLCTSEAKSFSENMSVVFKAGSAISLYVKGLNVSMPSATAIFRRIYIG